MTPTSPSRASPFLAVRLDWLALVHEIPVEPDLPIIDCHHHLWSRPESTYEAQELLSDITSGHRVSATVFVECRSHYLPQGERAFRSVGETEYVSALASSVARPDVRPVEGIVGYVDLQAGVDLVLRLLEIHRHAAHGRLRGIRNLSSGDIPSTLDRASSDPSLLMSTRFREGFALLQAFDLVFDAWMFHTQLNDLVDLARAFPATTIVLNHCGGPVGLGLEGNVSRAALQFWQAQLEQVATCENVQLKIGGLGMPHCGFGFHEQARPPASTDLASAWRPIIDHCLHTFGTHRCMFESNFPVDKASYSYTVLWNAFKELTRHYPPQERELLFWKNAARTYHLDGVCAALRSSALGPDA